MKYRFFHLTCTFALILLGSFASSTYAQGHTIRGKYKFAGYKRWPISVSLERNGALIDQTVSNNEGDFTFTALTDTSYTLVISAPTTTRQASLSNSETLPPTTLVDSDHRNTSGSEGWGASGAPRSHFCAGYPEVRSRRL